MKLAFCCPYYGPTYPGVGFGQRANIMNAAAAGHEWIADYSADGMQHRPACEAMVQQVVTDARIDAVFWTEHDVLLPPNAVELLAETLEKTGADIVTGIVFRRSVPFAPMVFFHEPLPREQYERMRESEVDWVRQRAHDLTYEELAARWFRCLNRINPDDEPYEVAAASMGCLLIKRSALETVIDDPELFVAEKHLSIDHAFFTGCRARGLTTYCAPGALCGHMGDPQVFGAMDWKRAVMAAQQAAIEAHEKRERSA